MVDGPLFSEGPGSPRKPHDGESAGCFWVQKSKLLVIEVKTISCHYSRWAPAHQPMDPTGGPWAQEPSSHRYGLGQKPPERLLRRAWVPRVLQEATNWGTGHPSEIRPREQEKRKAASQEREAKETERKRRKGGGGRSWSPPGLCRSEPRSPLGRARGGGGPRPEPGNVPKAAPPKARQVPWLPEHLRPSGRPPRPAAQWLREPGAAARAGPRVGRPSGPPSYEAHLLLRGAAGPVPRRRWDRPPPYVAPPSYDGPHRTLGAKRPPQLPRLPAPLAPAPSVEGKDREELPRKRLDPRIYRDVLGAWGIRQGRGTLGGFPGCGGPGLGGKTSDKVPGFSPVGLNSNGSESYSQPGANQTTRAETVTSGTPQTTPRTKLPLRDTSEGERAGEQSWSRKTWGPSPGDQPPQHSQTLPRPWAPGGPREKESPGERGGSQRPSKFPTDWKETQRAHTVPRSPRSSGRENGVFVIDATCVVIRAQFIPTPQIQHVQLLPSPGPRDWGDSLAFRKPRKEEGEEEQAFPSPCQKLLQSSRLSHQPNKGCSETWDEDAEAREPEDPSLEERASRILGLPIRELDLGASPVQCSSDPSGPSGVAERCADGTRGSEPAARVRRPAGRGWVRDPGPYAGALREAVSRIRRHTAPDSDSDEAPDCGARSCSSEGSDTEASGVSGQPERSLPGGLDTPGTPGGRGEIGRRAGELRDCIREILDVICQTEEALFRAEGSAQGKQGGGHPQP
ncbi:dendrin-like [Vombatus ursinus]|uniref:dendrin n=1 Tax=Vombatus ursinus TaxID=29139 RepID=UPI000FFD45A1|nr:dendrin [Vombatus ursinus]XP_027714360.1 dendrin-like [Vombatus ursinus]XP_027714365.1 dendrin-like [Vombatus ursinus]